MSLVSDPGDAGLADTLVEQDDLENTENFLALGFPPDSGNAAGVPLLCLAVRRRHPGLVRLLLESAADPDRPARDRGNSALMDAAVQGDADIAAALIEAGAVAAPVDALGMSARKYAMLFGRRDLAALLDAREGRSDGQA